MKIAAAIDLLLALITQAQRVSAIIGKARAEGRDTLDDQDLLLLERANDEARVDLERAIDQARTEGR